MLNKSFRWKHAWARGFFILANQFWKTPSTDSKMWEINLIFVLIMYIDYFNHIITTNNTWLYGLIQLAPERYSRASSRCLVMFSWLRNNNMSVWTWMCLPMYTEKFARLSGNIVDTILRFCLQSWWSLLVIPPCAWMIAAGKLHFSFGHKQQTFLQRLGY